MRRCATAVFSAVKRTSCSRLQFVPADMAGGDRPIWLVQARRLWPGKHLDETVLSGTEKLFGCPHYGRDVEDLDVEEVVSARPRFKLGDLVDPGH